MYRMPLKASSVCIQTRCLNVLNCSISVKFWKSSRTLKSKCELFCRQGGSWHFAGAMRCFSFSNTDRKDEPKTTKSISTRYSISSTDHETRKSGSESNSQTVSDTSTESSTKISFNCLSQRPSSLRVFSFAELKTATRNFSRSVMIGEGGFGGVYRGIIRDIEDPDKRIDIAVKQLSRRGLQVSKVCCLWKIHFLAEVLMINMFQLWKMLLQINQKENHIKGIGNSFIFSMTG